MVVSITERVVKAMFDIGLSEFEVTERTVNADNDYIYHANIKNAPTVCPACNSNHIVIHKKHDRMIRDLNEYEHRVGIIIHGRRYQCKDCGNTFSDELNCVDKSGRLTKRLIAHIQQECFEKTFKIIAEEYGISQPSIRRLFDDYVEDLSAAYSLDAPQVLGIDEVHLHSQYRGVFVDVLGQRVIEMTETRSKPVVKKFLSSIPHKENIQCVTMDMWQPYKDAVNEVLPNVPIVIDKFHVIKELNNALESIRKTLRKDMEKESRVSLKNMRFLFLTGAENLSPRQSKQLNDLLDEYPQFKTPYFLKEAFRDMYQFAKTREEAEDIYSRWVAANIEEGCTAYDGFMTTVSHWYNEIFNYFDNRYTNAQTESLNNVIREIDRAGRGYTFPVLRAKVLFRHITANKKSKFSF